MRIEASLEFCYLDREENVGGNAVAEQDLGRSISMWISVAVVQEVSA